MLPHTPEPSPSAKYTENMAATSMNLQPNASTPSEEAERVRKFLIYLLACDYNINFPVELSITDHTHFLKLSKATSRLQFAAKLDSATKDERAALAPFFWCFIDSPCQALGLSSNILLGKLRDLRLFVSCFGNYMGARRGTLHHYGMEALARKIWTDRYFVLAAVVADPDVRAHFETGIDLYQAQYFESILGYEAYSKEVDYKSTASGRAWAKMEGMRFTLNERGRAYQAARERGVQSCPPNRLSPEIAFMDASKWLKKYLRRVLPSVSRKETRKEASVKRILMREHSRDARSAIPNPDLWEGWVVDKPLAF